ncbi:hypothetical protein ACFOZ0_18575 [Streptomyces yaanensis]|uniref:Lipoprotein n=1 Tax=Streptomyces yaanensis TaxID=1142239 RepID=A0ABV7SE60_9ACTN|nr:hypothetical protein [Streptomyces sp. CGMCC 4.7035]WNB98116.1 hypothetical protein Q2K21_08520 [Streptomyces sp. CGMCC 4.7035]
MPFPFPPPPRIRLRRRSLLASAAGAALLAGCSDAPDSATTGGSASAADRARARAARDSEALAERYAAVIAAHPELAERLRPLRAEVARHAQAFGGGAGTSASASASASPSRSASPSASATTVDPTAVPSASRTAVDPSAVPSASATPDFKAVLAELAAAERSLADLRTKALLDVPGELARLMASVAAAGAAHAYLLTEGGK